MILKCIQTIVDLFPLNLPKLVNKVHEMLYINTRECFDLPCKPFSIAHGWNNRKFFNVSEIPENRNVK